MAAAHIAVDGQRQFSLGWLGKGLTVESRLEDRGDRSVAHRAQCHGAGAGRLQALLAVMTGKTHDAQAGAIALFRMPTRFELVADYVAGARADAHRPVEHPAG